MVLSSMKIQSAIYWKKEKNSLVIAAIILILFLLPPFVLGENAHIRVHDNMDSNIAWYKVLKDQHQLFGPIKGIIPQIIGGLPRNAFGSEFSGIQWLYHLFPPITAYALSESITRIFAFIGMYLLLKRHFIKAEEAYPVRVWVSLAFALTPFWPSGMLSTLGQPLALWAFLTIRENKASWKEWLTIILLPFYSSFVLGFFFFLTAMGILWVRDTVVRKNLNIPFIFSILLMTIIYLGIEYRLVVSLVAHSAPTNRNEFFESTLSFWRSVRLAGKNYLIGHTHVSTIHTYIILPLSFLVLFYLILKKEWRKEKRYLILFLLNIVLSVWYAFWFYKGWEPLKAKVSLLNTFNFARFHFLRPMVIYTMFALGCFILWEKGGKWKRVVWACLILQISILFFDNPEFYYRAAHDPSFKQFYAKDEFKKIEKFIGKPKSSYRVVSIGLHPAIAQYNGFYTLDTYNNFYPLSYKHQFRKIIAKELNKNKTIKKYFDQWGGRCYIFTAELGKKYEIKKNSKKKLHHLQLNTGVLRKMGGEYVFSAVPILNAEEDGLHFLKSFTDKDAAWKVYLYHVK
jgi:hypothetical protein